jgi:ATP-dependent DNA helicase PIF1
MIQYSTIPEDYDLFASQFWDILSPDQWAECDDVLYLLPTCASVLEFNCHWLVASAKPVLCRHAKHNHAEVKNAKSYDAEGSEREVLLAEGEKVMLTSHLWTSKGLANGAQGVVKKIWFGHGSNAHIAIFWLWFLFNSMDLLDPKHQDGKALIDLGVSISPAVAHWETNAGKDLVLTWLPLMMAWGIAIHKSQGLTLEKVVVKLGDKDFSADLTLVAISGVKTLWGFAFLTNFDHAQLKKPKETDSMLMLKRDTEHSSQLGFQLNTYGMDLSEHTFLD